MRGNDMYQRGVAARGQALPPVACSRLRRPSAPAGCAPASPRSAARPPRRARAGCALCFNSVAMAARAARRDLQREARAHRRLGRPPRQRHAADLRRRSACARGLALHQRLLGRRDPAPLAPAQDVLFVSPTASARAFPARRPGRRRQRRGRHLGQCGVDARGHGDRSAARSPRCARRPLSRALRNALPCARAGRRRVPRRLRRAAAAHLPPVRPRPRPRLGRLRRGERRQDRRHGGDAVGFAAMRRGWAASRAAARYALEGGRRRRGAPRRAARAVDSRGARARRPRRGRAARAARASAPSRSAAAPRRRRCADGPRRPRRRNSAATTAKRGAQQAIESCASPAALREQRHRPGVAAARRACERRASQRRARER